MTHHHPLCRPATRDRLDQQRCRTPSRSSAACCWPGCSFRPVSARSPDLPALSATPPRPACPCRRSACARPGDRTVRWARAACGHWHPLGRAGAGRVHRRGIASIFHDYWAVPADQQMMQQLVVRQEPRHVGGLLAFVAFGAGRFSLDAKRGKGVKTPDARMASAMLHNGRGHGDPAAIDGAGQRPGRRLRRAQAPALGAPAQRAAPSSSSTTSARWRCRPRRTTMCGRIRTSAWRQ